ncbi:MAG: hypothetical protein ACOC3V_03180 [bacterium]
MKSYNDYLNKLLENKRLYELAISKEKRKDIKRFSEVGDFKSILNEINPIINNIRKELLDLNFNDIQYHYHKDNIEIRYNSKLNALLNSLNEILFYLYNNDEIMDKIFGNGYRDMFLNIELTGDLNRLVILNGLPDFMKNLGVGKKIYKKLIKDFNYVSSFYGFNPSMESDMVWDSIMDDNDIYSFLNDDNIISFWNEYNFDNIIVTLKDFYNIEGKRVFDDDFLIKYNLTDDELNDIIG